MLITSVKKRKTRELIFQALHILHFLICRLLEFSATAQSESNGGTNIETAPYAK